VHGIVITPTSPSEIALDNAFLRDGGSRSVGQPVRGRVRICQFDHWCEALLLICSWSFFFALFGCGSSMMSSAAGTLVVSPSMLSFGTVSIGQTAAKTLSLQNQSSTAVTISALEVTGQSFSVSSPSGLPAALAPGETYSLNVQFNPSAASAVNSQLTIASNSSSSPTVVIGLSGTGTESGTGTGSIATLSGLSCSSASMTGSGTDACKITLNAAAPSGGLVVSLSSNNTAVTLPATVTVPANSTSAGFTATVSSVANAQKVTLTAVAGSVTKSFALQLNANVPTLTVTTSGTPSSYGKSVTFTARISSGPTGTLTFQNGTASIGTGTINGTTATLTTSRLGAGSHTITANWPGNSSYAAVTSSAIIQVVNKVTPTVTWATPAAITYGTALSATQLDASSTVAGKFVYSPAAGTVLAVGSHVLLVTLEPTDSTDYTAASKEVALTVNQGTATLSINATSIAFGNVVVNTSATQSLTLTSTGSSAVTVNSATLKGSGFKMTGATFPVTLAPGQTATLNVQFAPTSVGAATGQLTIASNSSTNGTAQIALSGTGVATSYAVNLGWDAPTSTADPVVGYNVYRATGSSTAYQLLNSPPETQTAYADSTVQSGQTYTYEVKSVDASGVESSPSNPFSVTIP